MKNRRYQPLLVDVEHLSGNPMLSVKLDGQVILSTQPYTARYVLESLMPNVVKFWIVIMALVLPMLIRETKIRAK